LTALSNPRAVMTMFSDPNCVRSHIVRLVLAEKGVQVDIESVEEGNEPADFEQLNPSRSLPTLVDRDLVLYDARVICDYLDERYPHPPFMPIDPVSRARTRLALFRIESEWYSLVPALESGGSAGKSAAAELADSLTASADLFAAMPFFLSEEFSMLDATIAPLLWRLKHYGVELSASAKPVTDYASKIMARSGFQASLSAVEREYG